MTTSCRVPVESASLAPCRYMHSTNQLSEHTNGIFSTRYLCVASEVLDFPVRFFRSNLKSVGGYAGGD